MQASPRRATRPFKGECERSDPHGTGECTMPVHVTWRTTHVTICNSLDIAREVWYHGFMGWGTRPPMAPAFGAVTFFNNSRTHPIVSRGTSFPMMRNRV